MRISLRYKLFLIILLANALVASAIVVTNNRAFDAGFEAYLEQVQSRRLAPLLSALSDIYADQGSWAWVQREPIRFYRLVSNATPGRSPRDQRREPVLLSDADNTLLIGDPRLQSRAYWLPIELNGDIVGSLGVPQAVRLGAEFDRLFASQQRRQLRWIALITLLVSAALAIPFAARLLRPMADLKTAFHRLASGDLNIEGEQDRLVIRGNDELADLAKDFNVLAETLKRNQQARQRWIVDIAHELRTPIAVLKAEIEALLDGVRQPDPDTLTSLFQEVQRLGGLVNDLRDLSLGDAGTLTYQPTELDLMDVLSTVHGHFDLALARHHLDWTLQAPPAPVMITGDPNRLVQLFSNLMQNSLRYTDGSAGQAGRVQVQVEVADAGITVHWSDSAPGVPDDALALLFDRLYRVDASRSRASGGSGLGLSIVRSIVDAHHGQVTATHSPLGGLVVSVVFAHPEHQPGFGSPAS
ncbi:ATP-binding protein [Saccharospirillum impatiens]|uniref:ATP-binding protein n=1 Tax=Saccharospirillum impatiens TaxID=169438 RepID=UPI0003F7C81A|nr:ATP-binding protein [Saccharospirillum impatiens]